MLSAIETQETVPSFASFADLISVEEAAAYLKVSKSTLFKYNCIGKIVYYKSGRRAWYRRSDLDAYLETCRIEPEQKRLQQAARELRKRFG